MMIYLPFKYQKINIYNEFNIIFLYIMIKSYNKLSKTTNIIIKNVKKVLTFKAGLKQYDPDKILIMVAKFIVNLTKILTINEKIYYNGNIYMTSSDIRILPNGKRGYVGKSAFKMIVYDLYIAMDNIGDYFEDTVFITIEKYIEKKININNLVEIMEIEIATSDINMHFEN